MLPSMRTTHIHLSDRDSAFNEVAAHYPLYGRSGFIPEDMQQAFECLSRFVDWSYPELVEYTKGLPRYFRACATRPTAEWTEVHEGRPVTCNNEQVHPEQAIRQAEQLFGVKIPGKSPAAQLARVLDPTFWRRALWKRIWRMREYAALYRGYIGAKACHYVSEGGLKSRTQQLARQRAWIEATSIATTTPLGESIQVPMAAVVATPQQRMSEMYAFIGAMDSLAQEASCAVAMITLTLEPEFHANPEYGRSTWNGVGPDVSSQVLSQRWADVRRDLADKKVFLSGFWAAEPHKDCTPHRHAWVIYRPEAQKTIFRALLDYFPRGLKVRRAKMKDRMYEVQDGAMTSRAARVVGKSGGKRLKTEGAQVDVSIINRSRGSGASYAFKYLQGALLREGASEKGNNFASIDASRGWGMRSYGFFGVRNCLTLWRKLRRVNEEPATPVLAGLWEAARGGKAEGRVRTGTQRGSARKFLELLGGLAAVGARALVTVTPAKEPAVELEYEERYVDPDTGEIITTVLPEKTTVARVNRYGEAVDKVIGYLVEGELLLTKVLQWTLVSARPSPH